MSELYYIIIFILQNEYILGLLIIKILKFFIYRKIIIYIKFELKYL